MIPRLSDESTTRGRSGFTLIELLIVVVIIGILVSIAMPKFSNTKEKAYVATMRGDLRNLVTAQESYVADFQTYYGGPLPNPAMTYDPSNGITITVIQATNAGFSARATMPAFTPRQCVIFIGPVAPVAPAVAEGQIACT